MSRESLLRPGLASVSLRGQPPETVVDWAARAGLAALEWGGDVHVPPGDLRRAARVGALTRERGLEVSAYGSYHVLGLGQDFAPVLDAALALGADLVRVWAGRPGEALPDPHAARSDLARLVAEAGGRGLRVACEYHWGTLTQSARAVHDLYAGLGERVLRAHWQPDFGRFSAEERRRELLSLLPTLSHVHVFYWQPDSSHKRPLAAGAAEWRPLLRPLRQAGQNIDVTLEFLPQETPDTLAREARTLLTWLAQLPALPPGAPVP